MKTTHQKGKDNLPVAIIGMGCFFPKSSSLKEYWRLLINGIDGITKIPKSHWSPDDYFDQDPKKKDHIYCKRGGFLSPVSFDPTEFAIPPSSIEATDTSQLLGLLAAKAALEDSGYGNGRPFNREKTSVILGVTGTQELVIPLGARLGYPKWKQALEDSGISAKKTEEVIRRISDSYVSWQENSFPGLLGNVVAGRISNRFDLGGTNCVVDAACASSMSAINLAVLELLSGRSDMVITGGVDTLNDIFMHMCFARTNTLSRTGDARPFSRDADGTVLGEGIGMIILKRLEDAENDHDRIYAVIRSIGSSSDGKAQSIYAPKPEGQENALRMAYDNAGIDTKTVETIEAHGTGTKVGDMVELQALKTVFNNSCLNGNRCAIGSVKSMIGHTKAAAGAAGIIKSALSLYNKVLPPTIKVDTPVPELNMDNSPFYLITKKMPWFSKKAHPRRSGVSAFGFGGSNFHVVLEEYTKNKAKISWDGSVEIIALSASTHGELITVLNKLKQKIDQGISKTGFAVMAAGTRTEFSSKNLHRLLLVIEINADFSDNFSEISKVFQNAKEALEKNKGKAFFSLKNIFYGCSVEKSGLAFIFPGQGSQYVGMGCDLVCFFPEAFNIMEQANETFQDRLRLSDFIYPRPPASDREKNNQEKRLQSTDIAQPAVGAVSLSMLKALEHFGVMPDATAGHSFGELTALHAAGRIDINTFMRLAVSRGSIMADVSRNNSKESGSMLAVQAPLQKLETFVKDMPDLILANKNSPSQGVLSGSTAAIIEAEKKLGKLGYKAARLPVSAAFHSSLIKGAQKPFMEVVQTANITPSDIPVFSNASALPYPDDQDASRKLLGKQIICPVDFVTEIQNLFDSGISTFIEIGPKSVLTGLVKSILDGNDFHAVSMDRSFGKKSGIADFAKTLSHIASLGHLVELEKWESYPLETRKNLMSMPISGANSINNMADKKSHTIKTENNIVGNEYKNKKNSPKMPVKSSGKHGLQAVEDANRIKRADKMTKNPEKKQNSDFISDAFSVVRDGLKSIQALQNQTSETHQKFLETQQEASRTLQEMMKSTQRLAEASLGLKNIDAPSCTPQDTYPDFEIKKQNAKRTDRVSTKTSCPGCNTKNNIPCFTESRLPQQSLKETPAESPETAQGTINSEIEETILGVVAQLTGYPEEMLGLDMDIETDLGIDSIKRVEIFSVLEEKMPGLPSVSPDKMAELKTLGQIVNYLLQTNNPNQLEVKPDKKYEDRKESDNRSKTGYKEIENILSCVIAELTGYPEEMLGLDMDIETDLGIDSIKRVEIFSVLEEKMPGLPSVSPDKMAELKTLGQIVEHLSNTADTDCSTEISNEISVDISIGNDDKLQVSDQGLKESSSPTVQKKIVSVVEKPADFGRRLSIPAGTKIYVTDNHTSLAKAICNEFVSQHIDAELVTKEIIDSCVKLSPAGGLVILPDMDSNADMDWITQDDRFLKDAFAITKHFADDLINSAKLGNALFATITNLDGAFGFKGNGVNNPLQGGLAGLSKTASLEWEDVYCRAVDISPDWKNEAEAARAIVGELLNAEQKHSTEVGLDSGSRYILQLETSPFPENRTIINDIEPGDVFLISGGAKGITASCAIALASHANPAIILLGRSPLPSDEPEWLSGLNDEVQIKKAILKNEFRKKQPGKNSISPVEIEKRYKKHVSNREIKKNIESMESAGSKVLYYPVDIKNSDAVTSVVEDVRARYGRIKGIIHGAGIIDDSLIVDKKPDRFEEVFDTKVKGLRSLLEATRSDSLSHLVIFSSVSARLGNRGQADYAMANEALNKIARQESVKKSGCNVISINWGPWDGGMVSDALKREFARQKIALIPVKKGAECLLSEMAGGKNRRVETVIGSNIVREKDKHSVPDQKSKTNSAAQETKLSLTLKHEIDIEAYPILESHILDGKPVVPFAIMAEWVGHGALHENPGLYLYGIDDMRLFHGIKLDNEKKMIRIMTGKARKKDSFFEVDIEIKDGIKQDGTDLIHSKAKAILTNIPVDPPKFIKSELSVSKPYLRSIREIYDKILFHGDKLQGIQKISHFSSSGIVAEIAAAPSPSSWMKEPYRSRWIADPLVLDSAFQMATLWCYEEKGIVSLPIYTASYRQYREAFPPEGVTAVLEIKEVTDHKMKGDFIFLDNENNVVAGLTGYESVMDASLYKSFKPQYA